MCTFVAATVPIEKPGDTNPLLEQAQQIGVTGEQQQTQQSGAGTKNGSFEAFMGSFGNPKRWSR